MSTRLRSDNLAAHFQSAHAAREFLENIRWANGVLCPHCGSQSVGKPTKRHRRPTPLQRREFKCDACSRKFTVTTSTLFEGRHLPLNKWLYAIEMMYQSRQGASAVQVHRALDITYKSAWFMCRSLRDAMLRSPYADLIAENIVLPLPGASLASTPKEKPVVFFPLAFDEVLRALMSVDQTH